MEDLDPMRALPPLVRFFIATAGFVEGSIGDIGDELLRWRSELGYRPGSRTVRGDLVAQIRELSPLLDVARPRELLVECGNWVAYFDSFARSTDAVSTCSELADRLDVRALKITCAPEILSFKGMNSGPAMQFHLWGPEGVGPLRYVRTIDAVKNDERWTFELSGETLEFEKTESYANRRIVDRLTARMLQSYCSALGIDVFNADAYGPKAVLIESRISIPRGARKFRI